jgi:hypothetical protein
MRSEDSVGVWKYPTWMIQVEVEDLDSVEQKVDAGLLPLIDN